MKITTPANTTTRCDACGTENRAAFAMGATLDLKRAALDWQGGPVADASVHRDLCDSCQHKVSLAINEAVSGSKGGIPHNAVCFYPDGNKTCAVFADFLNIQESPCGFGDDFATALDDLKASLAAGKAGGA